MMYEIRYLKTGGKRIKNLWKYAQLCIYLVSTCKKKDISFYSFVNQVVYCKNDIYIFGYKIYFILSKCSFKGFFKGLPYLKYRLRSFVVVIARTLLK